MFQLRSSGNLLSIGAVLVALTLVVVLFMEMVRSERAHHEVKAGALSDYAGVAAWQYVRRAELDLKSSLGTPFRALRGNFPDIDELHEQVVAEAARCPCPHGARPGLTFRFNGESLEFSGDESLFNDGELRAYLTERLDTLESSDAQPNGLHFMGIDGEVKVVAYTVDHTGPPTITGYLAGIGPVKAILAKVFERHDLLPATLLGDSVQPDLLALRVNGPGGVLYESGPLEGPWRGHAAFDTLTDLISGVTVETALQPVAAELLLVGGTPRSRLPLLAALAGLAMLLGVLAGWQFFAERQLVRLRTNTIAAISHELRTPLAQIRLFTETLRLGRARDERERERALAVIDRECRRLDHLVNNVLRFGARESGGEALSPRELSLNAFFAEIRSEYQPLAEHHGTSVEMEVEGSLRVWADPEALRRILFNLLENAAKYSPAGKGVRVSAVPSETGGVEIRVDDAGPGVPLELRERIWAMYSRFNGNDTPGSGIGLAVVRHHAKLHGGLAWVEDAPGGGARFVVGLPTGVRG